MNYIPIIIIKNWKSSSKILYTRAVCNYKNMYYDVKYAL